MHAGFLTPELGRLVSIRSPWARAGAITMSVTAVGAVLLVTLLPFKEQIAVSLVLMPVAASAQVEVAASGRVERIEAIDGQAVRVGQVIMRLSGQGRVTPVEEMRIALTEMRSAATQGRQLPSLPELPTGPGLDAGYGDLRRAAQEIATLESDARPRLETVALSKQTADIEKARATLAEQLEFARRSRALASERLAAERRLVQGGWVSEAYTRSTERELFEQQIAERDFEIRAQTAGQSLKRLREEAAIRDETRRVTLAGLRSKIAAISTTLLEKATWQEAQLTVRAERSGVLHMDHIIKPGQLLTAGQSIAVIDDPIAPLFALSNAPSDGSARVQKGQIVEVEAPGYPKFKYGGVMGVVSRVANSQTEHGYQFEVLFPSGFVTTRGYRLPYKVNAEAKARVLIARRRLYERLLPVPDREQDLGGARPQATSAS